MVRFSHREKEGEEIEYKVFYSDGSPPMKYPDKFASTDWLFYLSGSLRRWKGIEWLPPKNERKAWDKGFKTLLESADPFMLACAIDLTAMHWVEHSVYEMLSPGAIFYWTRKVRKPKEWWRFVWFSRFAKTEKEVRYFVTWLDRLEDAYQHPTGVVQDNDRKTALDQLYQAERKIRERDESTVFLWEPLKKIT